MNKPIKSRHGLTRCGCCRAHIQASERPSETDCPFCGANLHRDRARSLPTGRGGFLAAALFAFAAGGCGGGGDDGDTSVEPGDDTAGDDTPAGDDTTGDDGTGDDGYSDQPADDNTAVAEYGVAPDGQ